ncbi:GIY-YIG nuclease family protein [Fodinibius salsisoli]|uniref:GIY-YIG nuclease family protein n=1 Tax=Fodinibius salsisoli TaxID=2820877 RepID=A0ABT3PKT7_9BACT|nr:GIY-YIG nuclease family protein [Fodinibius salsisoli]MCW9706541.1 GIY-YIG nuclease family protein [Fodinibius salsisoli]
MKHFLYILRSEVKETYYIGVSDDPERRLAYHNGESKGYTRQISLVGIPFLFPSYK